MSTPASIGVNDDLTSGETSVALWASNDELAGRIDVQVGVVTKKGLSFFMVETDRAT